jgi:Leucine-rich repeat (LRR) protein
MRILLQLIFAFNVIISSVQSTEHSKCRVVESNTGTKFSIEGRLSAVRRPEIPAFPCPSNLTIFGTTGCSLCTLTDIMSCLGSAVTNLPAPDELPQWISIYQVSSSLVQIIPRAAFLDRSIGEIHIQHNELALISQKAFEGVKKLRYITLANNGLPYIMVDMFDGLKDLNTLVLDDNNLEITDAGDFVGSSGYASYALAKQKGFFSKDIELENLENLSLKNNPLKQLPKQAFRWLKTSKISYLSLQGSKIQSVHKGNLSITRQNIFTLSNKIYRCLCAYTLKT